MPPANQLTDYLMAHTISCLHLQLWDLWQSTETYLWKITSEFHNYFISHPVYLFLKIRLLILEREEGGDRETLMWERNWLVASHTHSDWGSNLPPRCVPWRVFEPSTFWCVGRCSNQVSHTGQGFPTHFKLKGESSGTQVWAEPWAFFAC